MCNGTGVPDPPGATTTTTRIQPVTSTCLGLIADVSWGSTAGLLGRTVVGGRERVAFKKMLGIRINHGRTATMIKFAPEKMESRESDGDKASI